jgi:hypothetical protein
LAYIHGTMARDLDKSISYRDSAEEAAKLDEVVVFLGRGAMRKPSRSDVAREAVRLYVSTMATTMARGAAVPPPETV